MCRNSIDLLGILDVQPIDVNLFRGNSPNVGSQRVFGGQLIGQAMLAACRTAKGRLPHSLHCSFIRSGDPETPIIYRVAHLRDGKSYSSRAVTAVQGGNAILSVIVSFHAEEQGTFEHHDKMPDVPPPEELTVQELSNRPIFRETSEFIRRYYAIELRAVEIDRSGDWKIEDGRSHIWIKIIAKLPDDPSLHLCALAYASDYSLLDAVMARHSPTPFDKRMMRASLDHAMWFHRSFHVDDWLLYAHDSPSAQGGRGLARGLIFRSDGKMVASVAQEGSVRERR
ncbi:acyl-CoA thioesterase [Bradyrhizobium sp. 5.13L]